MSNDPYCYPNPTGNPDGERVLKNRFGITSNKELREEEYNATGARMIQIEIGDGPKGKFDADHLKALHRHIFQDVYEWAGYTRAETPIVDGERMPQIGSISKGGTNFLPGQNIDMGLADAFKDLSDLRTLKGISADEFSKLAGKVLGDLNYVHPFREGNGRTQETFIVQLGRELGHEVQLDVVSKARMIEGSKEAIRDADSKALSHAILDSVDPNRQGAIRSTFAMLREYGEDPMEHDVRTALPGERVTGNLIDHDELTIKVAAENYIVVVDRRDFPQKIEDEMEVDFVATHDFSGHDKARTYLDGSRESLLSEPELRKAVILETYVTDKTTRQFPNDKDAVDQAVKVAREKIAGMIANGIDIPSPTIQRDQDVDRSDINHSPPEDDRPKDYGRER
ncbi:cell filamentation protein [Rhizobium skierniewicense]|uniref:protein adenylyltransferase n=1 Tax=Rhizobium skierniewicense TaxID=984260 RepID=A0A7W6CJV1_9HYPH|nr:Fic family protein [Rhizobium skierniewicense]MBB3948421.1 cell filamentation protein [Rhizobium skierniewicense]